MKKGMIFAAIAMFASSAAFAGGACHYCEGEGLNLAVDNRLSASSSASAVASASAGAVAIQGQGQSQNVTVNNNAAGDVKYSGEYKVKDAPTVGGGALAPSALCHGTTSVGLSVVGFGMNLGSSWKDEDCQIIQTAMSLMALGMRDDAVAVMCQVEHVKVAPACAARQ